MSYIDVNQAALSAQNAINMQQLYILDNETGSSNKAPKLLNIDDYPHWKSRFEIHINGVDTQLWDVIENGYVQPRGEDGLPIMPARLTETQRTEYNREKKAFSLINQAIPRDIFHQFVRFQTAKTLWDALEQHCEGAAEERNLKAKMIKKEFDNFMAFQGEGITALVNRYYHLLAELHAHGIVIPAAEQIEQLAEGLPAGDWRSWYEMKKDNGTLANLDINAFVAKLRMREQDIAYRAKKGRQAQDPSLYKAVSTPSAPTHAPLATAFSVSQVNTPSVDQGYSTTKPKYSTSNYSVDAGKPNPSSSNSAPTTELNTENFGKANVSVVKEHMATLSSLVSAYDNLLAGNLVNNHMTVEDYDQLDRDEMERLDIIWCMASVIRRGKEYERRTGKQLNPSKDTKFGFDKSNVICYNCQEKGHFARECEKSKRPNNQRNPFTPRRDAAPNSTRVIVPVTTGNSEGSTSYQKGLMTAQFESAPDWSSTFHNADSNSDAPDANVARIVEIDVDTASETESRYSSESELSDNE